ncbi:CDP-diacylglycerol--glycerol-3-phosphate 3-phosphatidyltransferase [Mycoplasmoides alvi]|uniref:CDP-diacylglycerol--glycerol-3-phosphate 3-phosphatidyltransferase n=1 Tax=Mycoplasmoides alvi TaxID=78580 RepID=UPI000A056FCE|nr:CDP-diacylglycerol--glycerol-3-phosphate 3-phosphatidyltransferase [Mycoplasmoides alvi]
MIKKNIPNILTVSRIILIIPIIVLLSIETNLIYSFNFLFLSSEININVSIGLFISGILFIISGFTDWLDGYLARKWDVVSNIGKLWDPLADKILINSVLIIFAVKGYVHFIIVIIFVVRDIIIDGLRMFAMNRNILLSANIFGKLKTIFQMLACSLTFFVFGLSFNLNLTSGEEIWYWIIQMLIYWFALIFSILSCVIYFNQVQRLLKINQEQ